MFDWRQPDEDENDDDGDEEEEEEEDESVRQRAAWEKKREDKRWKTTLDKTGQTGSLLYKKTSEYLIKSE